MVSRSDAQQVSVAKPAVSSGSSAITKSWLLGGAEGSTVRQLGNYDIVARLGQGGMGKVYKARHRNLKRFFALKMLRTDIDVSADAIARFYREMEAIGRIDHDNVVAATDAGPLDGVDCLVMEYLEGVDLSSLLKAVDHLPVDLACEAVRQAANGLTAITKHSLVHRDIKPSNLFLTQGGQIKILDLGLARLGVDDDFTRRGEVYGTADYIAPEVAMGLGEYGAAADVYSLGCTLFKLLTGLAPFEGGDHDSFVSKMHAHVSEPPPRVCMLNSTIPAEIDSLLERMLAKPPHLRPPASEVASTLAAFVKLDSVEQLAGLASKHALVAEPISGSASSTPLGKSPAQSQTSVDYGEASRPKTQWRVGMAVAASIITLLAAAPLAMWAAGYHWPLTATQPEPLGTRPMVASQEAGNAELPAEQKAVNSEIVLRDGKIEVLKWTGSSDLSIWETGDDYNSMFVQTDGVGMFGLGSTGKGTHRLSVEVQQLQWPGGGWGVMYGYQTSDRESKVRYEWIGCVYHKDLDVHYLVRSQFRSDSESPRSYQDILAQVTIEVGRKQNFLELEWHDQQLTEVRLNDKPLPEMIVPSSHPAAAEPAQFGVYCMHAAATFYTPRLNEQVIRLHKPALPP